jgi:hypothetical protein
VRVKLERVELRLPERLAARVAGHAQEVDVGDAWDLNGALEAEEQALVRALLGLQVEQVLALVRGAAAGDLVVGVAHEHLTQRGLARAVLAHDRVHLALAHGQAHAVEDLLPALHDLGLQVPHLQHHWLRAAAAAAGCCHSLTAAAPTAAW